MTFNLDKDSLGELLAQAVRIAVPYCPSERRNMHWIAENAIRKVCEIIIRKRTRLPAWEFLALLDVDLPDAPNETHNENDDSDGDTGDWWKQSRYSRN